jgi:hypothetical protein
MKNLWPYAIVEIFALANTAQLVFTSYDKQLQHYQVKHPKWSVKQCASFVTVFKAMWILFTLALTFYLALHYRNFAI